MIWCEKSLGSNQVVEIPRQQRTRSQHFQRIAGELRRADEAVVIGKDAADRYCNRARAAMEWEKRDGLIGQLNHRDFHIGARLCYRFGKFDAKIRALKRRI